MVGPDLTHATPTRTMRTRIILTTTSLTTHVQDCHRISDGIVGGLVHYLETSDPKLYPSMPSVYHPTVALHTWNWMGHLTQPHFLPLNPEMDTRDWDKVRDYVSVPSNPKYPWYNGMGIIGWIEAQSVELWDVPSGLMCIRCFSGKGCPRLLSSVVGLPKFH